MANISINLSNALITKLDNATQVTSLGEEISLIFQAAYNFSVTHPTFSSHSTVGTNLRLNFPDGAYETYTGVTLSNPNATSGMATATNLEDYFPSQYRLTATGQLNYHYEATSTSSTIQGTGGTVTDAAIQTLLPSYSASYDALYGNVTLGIHGNVALSSNSDISGVITSVTGQADKMLVSSVLTGNFNISGNATNIAQNLSTLAVSGTASSLVEKYADGSNISLTGLALQVNGDSAFNKTLLSDANNFTGDDVINVTLGAVAANPWSIASGAGNDKVTIKGGGSSLSVNAGTGNDIITLGDSNHSIDGGAGVDTAVFSGARAAYSITKTGAGFSVQSSAGADTLANVERVQFSDSTLALDISGHGGQVYRLYQAAFNRVPDAGGLGYWIKAADNGSSLQSIAAEFAKSGEFTTMYGANPSNADFLDKLYHNVLHRAGDTAGFNYWLDILDRHAATQANVLAEFGESAENQAALIGSIGNGFTFTPYG
jgi:hypothetical protein